MNLVTTSPTTSAVRPRDSLELAFLTVLLGVLFAIPSRLTFPPLGGAGSPTQMLGMALAFVWALRGLGGYRLRTTALHWTVLLLLVSIMASYVGCMLRPATVMETSAADRGLLSMLGWLGLFLTVADGLADRRELDVFLRRVTVGGGFVAGVGLAQFVTKQQLTNYIQIPGLVASGTLELNDRNGFARPAGTALHAIEFGAVLTMILPFALHYAMHDTSRSLLRRWWPVVFIAIAVPISISRSAIVSAAVILILIVPTWSKSLRRKSYLALLGLGSVMYVLVPGLLGTITGLFSGLSSDDSATSRTDSYSLAGELISRHLLLGRGFRTLLTSVRIFDNQYLGILVEIGCFGLAAVVILFGTMIVGPQRRRRVSTDPATRSLARAFSASIASAACSMALFDMFGFPMAVSLLFLLIGGAAVFLRIAPLPAQSATVGKQV